ncbi:MAG: undecaprenyldiphospho-muramoylpentapeptide beta-N-acetylglucosaminyltransferase [Alphaproteobacteria bacterium]
MTADRTLILLAAGGTGGHMFPAEALAGELLRRGFTPALVTDRRGQAYGGTLGAIPVHRIHAGAIAGRNVFGLARGIATLALGTAEAFLLMRRLRPAVVVGFGGYASVPAVAAAIATGIPTAIHEQNAVLGRANRLLARRVSQVATSFAAVSALPPDARVVNTGMPVRPAIPVLRTIPYPSLAADDPASAPFRILVLGGSQGARILSEVIPAALALLPEPLRRRIDIAQQCRPEDIEAVRRAYRASGIRADLASFFTDVPDRLAAAHLVIARAGASTVAELTTAGRPAILVPYPHAVDDHQTANAHAVAETGGAWPMPQDVFTPPALAARLQSLIEMPVMLEKAAACARATGHPDAASRLADVVEALATSSRHTTTTTTTTTTTGRKVA